MINKHQKLVFRHQKLTNMHQNQQNSFHYFFMSICSSKFTLYLALLVTIRFSILVGTIEEQQQKIRNIGDAINKIIYIFNIVYIPYTYTQKHRISAVFINYGRIEYQKVHFGFCYGFCCVSKQMTNECSGSPFSVFYRFHHWQ